MNAAEQDLSNSHITSAFNVSKFSTGPLFKSIRRISNSFSFQIIGCETKECNEMNDVLIVRIIMINKLFLREVTEREEKQNLQANRGISSNCQK